MHLLLLHVHHVHLLLGRCRGSIDHGCDGLLASGLKVIGGHSCSPIKLDGSKKILQSFVLFVQQGTQVVVRGTARGGAGL